MADDAAPAGRRERAIRVRRCDGTRPGEVVCPEYPGLGWTIYRPTISRRPSASIAAAMGVASGTMRPPSRTLRSVASKPETGPSA